MIVYKHRHVVILLADNKGIISIDNQRVVTCDARGLKMEVRELESALKHRLGFAYQIYRGLYFRQASLYFI